MAGEISAALPEIDSIDGQITSLNQKRVKPFR
jgi:chorismate mutase